ncbi:MAG: (2Fe-2S) ferredoxin domain-containing protein [Bacteriovoracaceae bacterium]|nr:(2Fe-2S) ferredoxin domain-containing protein [Bacteriovoracaceae bacterium]
MPFKCHVFICTNKREEGESCGKKGAENLRHNLKDKCREAFGKEVRINTAGCLGRCQEGIAAVIYPQGIWKTQLKETDEDVLFEKIKLILP